MSKEHARLHAVPPLPGRNPVFFNTTMFCTSCEMVIILQTMPSCVCITNPSHNLAFTPIYRTQIQLITLVMT
jgi:hypothetical protein